MVFRARLRDTHRGTTRSLLYITSSEMKTIICVSVLLIVLCRSSSAVTVTEGDFHFSLESVKALRTLMTGDDEELRLVEAKAAAVCSHPALPEDFRALCLRKDAGASLARLALVATHADACEICESVACTGC